MSKFKLKKFYLHPITTYLFLIILVFVASFIFSLLGLQSTYNVININTMKVEQVTTELINLFRFTEIKNIVSNTSKNFISFAPLSMYLVAAIGIAVCEASGFLDVLFKKVFERIPNRFVTFIIILIATIKKSYSRW